MKDIKELRKQLRTVVKDELPQVVGTLQYQELEKTILQRLDALEKKVKDQLHEMNKRQKDTLGYLVRNVSKP
jgi:uncharacterized circularly permuted ATP-grasp superfamily protein